MDTGEEQPRDDEELFQAKSSLAEEPSTGPAETLAPPMNLTASSESRGPGELPALSVDEILGGSPGAGPWRKAFGVDNGDIKAVAGT